MEKEFILAPKIVLTDADGRCLVLRRSADRASDPGRWDLPGGKLEPGETFMDGLCREVREETGLEIAVERVAGVAEKPAGGALTAIVVILEGRAGGGVVRLSEEHDDVRWLGRTELAGLKFCDHLQPFITGYSRTRGSKSAAP